MAATSSFAMAFPVNYGRSGYNSKPDDEETQPPKDKGRSGYNKGSKDDEEDGSE